MMPPRTEFTKLLHRHLYSIIVLLLKTALREASFAFRQSLEKHNVLCELAKLQTDTLKWQTGFDQHSIT